MIGIKERNAHDDCNVISFVTESESFPCAWFVNIIQYCLCRLFFRKGGCWHLVKSPISLVVSASFGIPQNPHLYTFEANRHCPRSFA